MTNKETFHQVMGGRIRRDNRYSNNEKAEQIREKLIILREKGVYTPMLENELGVSGSTISLAAGGRSGDKIQARFGNLSSTDFILGKLTEMTEGE